MNEAHKQKLSQIANDEIMLGAVYQVLLQTFMVKKTGEDTQAKAARFVAIELLEEAVKELLKYKTDREEKSPPSGNVGL